MCEYCRQSPHACNCPNALSNPKLKRICPNCESELDEYSKVFYDAKTEEIHGCEECINVGKAVNWIKEE